MLLQVAAATGAISLGFMRADMESTAESVATTGTKFDSPLLQVGNGPCSFTRADIVAFHDML